MGAAGVRLGLTLPLEGLGVAETLIPMARLAEESGYTDIWTAEVSGVDGFTPLGAIAASTERLRLGTAIVPAFTRPPALLAMSAAAVQAISGGRFILGIGTSTSIIVGRWMGVPFEKPLVRMRETLTFLRDALEGKKVSFEGETVASQGFRLTTDPGSPVPLYIAGLGPKMLRLAGEMADGVILFLFTPEGARAAIDQVTKAAADAGRNPSDIDVVARIPVAMGEDEEVLRFMLRRLTTTYAMVDVYNASLTRQGFGEEAGVIAKKWTEGDRDAAAEAVTDEMLQSLYIFGDLDRCKARLEEFRQAGIKTPVVLPISVAGDPAERLQRLENSVKSLVRR